MTRQQRLTLVATILGSTIVFLDSTVVNVALPAIQRDLHTGLAGQQWIVEAYLLTLVSLLLVGGSLGDLYGRRRIYVIGLIGFAITSILSAIAPTTETLVAARALQGTAGALLVPGSLALLAATFEGEARGRAVGQWTAWAGISALIGPAGGGLLVAVDWRLVFWVNLPLILGTLWLVLHAVDESSDPDACPGIDGVGIALSALGLAGPVFALIERPIYGWGNPVVWGPLAAGVACFAGFLWWERRARAPLLPLEMFRVRDFSAVNLATLCVYAGLMGSTFFLTLFLQQVAGYSPFHAGAATTPITILMFLLSGRFGALASRIGPRLVMGLGPIVAAAGLAWLARLDSHPTYAVDVLPSMLVFGLGLSMTVAPLTTTVLDSVEERHAGIASGINNAVSRVAGVLAIAAIGAVISGQFSSQVDQRASGQRLSPQAHAAIERAKRQPLSGGSVRGLPRAEAARVHGDVVAASEAGFHAGVLVAAALMALGGAIALIAVRRVERPPEPEPHRGPGPLAAAGECGRVAEHPQPTAVPVAVGSADGGGGPGLSPVDRR